MSLCHLKNETLKKTIINRIINNYLGILNKGVTKKKKKFCNLTYFIYPERYVKALYFKVTYRLLFYYPKFFLSFSRETFPKLLNLVFKKNKI